MALCDDVRAHCAATAASARWVEIDLEAAGRIQSGPPPALDPDRHFLEGSREEVARYLVALDAINFGSGWFPTLRKRPGLSGYFTIASALTDRFRREGPWTAEELDRLGPADVASVLGQDEGSELMALYAAALNEVGRFLEGRSGLAAIEAAAGSAERLAEQLVAGMPMWDDPGYYKRAQILPNDLALAGVAEFGDLDRLTVFADNLVPHVLRTDGVLRYHPDLAARIDAGELVEPGSEPEGEIRACAVHACEEIADGLGVEPRTLDVWLWNRGQAARYKERPRHRTRTTAY